MSTAHRQNRLRPVSEAELQRKPSDRKVFPAWFLGFFWHEFFRILRAFGCYGVYRCFSLFWRAGALSPSWPRFVQIGHPLSCLVFYSNLCTSDLRCLGFRTYQGVSGLWGLRFRDSSLGSDGLD